MKKINSIITNLVLISIFAAFGCINAMAQVSDEEGTITSAVTEEKRPFDFSDKFYSINGVEPSLIFNRRTGADNLSVFDKIDDEAHRTIRITATMPAYNYDGEILYWNLYGELFPKSFIQSAAGRQAMKIADRFPIFVFPSETQRGTNRQSSIIETRNGYFKENPLGLGVLIEVRFTSPLINTADEEILKEMANRNGVSLDGTPIIKTIEEINLLISNGLATQKVKGLETQTKEPSYAIAKVIENPNEGAITPDAFLIYLKQQDGAPLKSESFFINKFTCLQSSRVCALDTLIF
ncbi:MAG: hypothetical protein WA584_00555 [Pyrinomonadaceae bacterium]